MVCEGIWKNESGDAATATAASRVPRRAHVASALALALFCAACGADQRATSARRAPTARGTDVVEIHSHLRVPGVTNQYLRGTGWVYDASRGLIITAYHVVNGSVGNQIRVGRRVRPARLVAASPCEDTAMLQVKNRSGLRSAVLADTDAVRDGEELVTTGYTRRGFLRQRGRIRSFHTGIPAPEEGPLPPVSHLIEMENRMAHGQSGGPMRDRAGRVAGMAVMRVHEPRGTRRYGIGIRAEGLRETVGGFLRGKEKGHLGNGLFFAPKLEGVLVTGLRHGGYPGGAVVVTAVDGEPVGNNYDTWCATAGGVVPGPAEIDYFPAPDGPERTMTTNINVAHRMR